MSFIISADGTQAKDVTRKLFCLILNCLQRNLDGNVLWLTFTKFVLIFVISK